MPKESLGPLGKGSSNATGIPLGRSPWDLRGKDKNKNMKQTLNQPYNRQSFIDNVLLPTVRGRVNDLKIYDLSGAEPLVLTASEQQYAKSVIKYGEFATRDETGRSEGMPFPKESFGLAKVALYEVILQDDQRVERSRVGIAALVKKQIIGNDAVLVNFAYEQPENRPWRFSFIAYDAVFAAGEMQQTATNPKRYTYVFGEPEETYRTAYERFSTLGREKDITVASLKNAFGVEALSKAFFDEYRDTHYTGFVDYLRNSPFKQSVFNADEKAIRDFVKKLLGRIVFLYFIQKKGWLGAKNEDYQDGDKNFMSHFYQKAGANESFYATWLSKLFFGTLNNSQRPDDAFEMPDGSVVRIPYLNGGLFEKESDKYDFLTFPPNLFGNLFENLLEDNKDKGAFYTPKEIVHYMTQASLIEYLHTRIPEISGDELEAFVKNKDNSLTENHKKQIDEKLDAVKICDPAIGSGAFPMGLLQEIFGLKERIAHEFGYSVWSPARVKEHIIQNSIYGVDIEQGAVDIARLRFWLSLIVDEDKPKPLPNLDYKIVQGNSLVSKFAPCQSEGFSNAKGIPSGRSPWDLWKGHPLGKDSRAEGETLEIDWSTDDTSAGLFGQEFIAERTRLLKAISEKQKEFFTANTAKKPKLAKEIRKLKLEILAMQLKLMIATKGAKKDKNAVKKPSKKQLEKILETEGWKRTLSKVNQLKLNDQPFNHFDWKLDFPEVLNPLAVANTGFDIVIGNPPYIDSETMVKNEKDLREIIKGRYQTARGNWDLFIPFVELGFNNSKVKSQFCFIIPNKIISAKYTTALRQYLCQKEIKEVRDYSKIDVFKDANVYPITISINNNPPKSPVKMTIMKDIKHSQYSNCISASDFYKDILWSKYFFEPSVVATIRELETNPCLSQFSNEIEVLGAATVGEAYQVKEVIEDRKPFEKDLKFINTGTIDPYLSLWGQKPTQYIKDRYSYPVIPLEQLEKISTTRSMQAKSPKLIIAGMSKSFETFLDMKGEYLAGKSTTIVTGNPDNLKYLMAILNSNVSMFYLNYTYHSLKMSGGYLNVGTDIIKSLPVAKGNIVLVNTLCRLFNSMCISGKR